MNKQIKVSIVVLLLVTIVGFAAISLTLNFTGNINIKGSYDNFSNGVIFSEAAMDTTSTNDGATATIATDGKSITFTTQTLDTLNEQAVLTYKIKNDSQYNAQLGEMNCSSGDTDYVQITRGGALTNTTIAKGETSAADTITVKLVKTYSETTPKKVTITCDLNATAQSAAA